MNEVRREKAPERRLIARIEHGGARALAKTAAEVLEQHDASPADLLHAAYLLKNASQLADHAALYLRLADEGDAMPGPQEDGAS